MCLSSKTKSASRWLVFYAVHAQRRFLAHGDEQFFTPASRPYRSNALQEHVMLHRRLNHHRGKFRSLRFVDGHGVGRNDFVQLAIAVCQGPAVIANHDLLIDKTWWPFEKK